MIIPWTLNRKFIIVESLLMPSFVHGRYMYSHGEIDRLGSFARICGISGLD